MPRQSWEGFPVNDGFVKVEDLLAWLALKIAEASSDAADIADDDGEHSWGAMYHTAAQDIYKTIVRHVADQLSGQGG